MPAYQNKPGFRTFKPGIAALITLIAALASSAFSQDYLGPRLDLETAVETAINANPKAKLSETQTRTAEAKIAEAKTGKLPFVQFSQSFTRSNNPVFVFGSLLEQGRFGEANFALNSLNHPDGLNNFRTAVDARVPLFDQRQTFARITQAKNTRSQADLESEAVRQQLRFDVVRGYFGVVLAKSMVSVYGDAVASAEANLKKTKDMVEVGFTTEADSLAADVELANILQQQLESESGLVMATAELNLTLGDQPDLERELSGNLRETYFPVEEQDELIRIALENRPDYKHAELDIENSRVRSKAVKDLRLPQVSAFGNFGYSSPYITNGSSDYTVGVSLSYTLFDPGRKARIAQSAEGESAAGFKKEILADQVRLEVIRAYQKYKTASAKIKVSIKSIARSEEVLRITQDRYKFALATFNDVLRAEAALVRSKHDLMLSRFEYYISYASVLLATGRLNDVSAFQ
jgi:outer membrane protein TolC